MFSCLEEGKRQWPLAGFVSSRPQARAPFDRRALHDQHDTRVIGGGAASDTAVDLRLPDPAPQRLGVHPYLVGDA
ncbi:hypothetical protein BJY21_003248 [Kineosphaera limosa]|nr:hypothetical protein [Kineosphaera limosa]